MLKNEVISFNFAIQCKNGLLYPRDGRMFYGSQGIGIRNDFLLLY
eukprot:TCALIF_03619-PA protein Name:"Protein of unknown function" AED:0.30 eAED:0.30 QI:0/0/0.5/0.5/1/1/2/217/44